MALEHYESHITPEEAYRHLVEDKGFSPDQLTLLASSGGAHILRTLAKLALEDNRETPYDLKEAYMKERGLI